MATAVGSDSDISPAYITLDDDFEYIFEVLENDEGLNEEINDICTNVSIYLIIFYMNHEKNVDMQKSK